MTKTIHSTYWLAALAAVGLVGCGAETGVAELEVATSTQALATHVSLGPYHGGYSGTWFSTPSGTESHCNGYQLRSGQYVDQVRLKGINGSNVGPFGSAGGSLASEQKCTGDDLIIGMYGYASNYINKLGFTCANSSRTSVYQLPASGGSGGSAFFDTCPPGTYVSELVGRSGAWLDAVRMGCRAPDIETVLGFDKSSYWSVSNGVKGTTRDVTQGAGGLSVTDFSYTELTSGGFGAIESGVTSTMLLDVKPPTTPSWGQMQLFVNFPSRGLYNQPSNSVALAGLANGVYSTVAFTLPSNVVSALALGYTVKTPSGSTYVDLTTDLTFKITVSVPQTSQRYLFDNLRFQPISPPASKVEMRVADADDFLFVTVNGIRRKVMYLDDPQKNVRMDVSGWFAAGDNTVRLQSVNTGGPVNTKFELWVDDNQVVSKTSPAGVSDIGIAADETVTVSTPNRPAFQTVTLSSYTPGKLYVNDVYTGLSTPTALKLPQGRYKFGVAIGSEAPFNYWGNYYETSTNVTTNLFNVDLTAGSALPVQRRSRMVVVPVQTIYNYVPSLGRPDASNAGILTANDVTIFRGQVDATRTVWFEPFSYGLASWDVTFLPMVTNAVFEERIDSNNQTYFATEAFLAAAGLSSLLQQYDHVVVFFSQHRADGTDVADAAGGYAWASGKVVGINTTCQIRGKSANDPNPFLLHEVLHHHDGYNNGTLHLYSGINGLDGTAEVHGYYNEGSSGETDVVKFYRIYMRGQLAELDGMRPNINWPSIPANSDLYTGVFQTLRTLPWSCTPGTKRCTSDQEIQVCKSDGTWDSASQCPGVSEGRAKCYELTSGAVCGLTECIPGETKCVGEAVTTCYPAADPGRTAWGSPIGCSARTGNPASLCAPLPCSPDGGQYCLRQTACLQ